LCDQIKEDELGGTRSEHGGVECANKILVEEIEGKRPLDIFGMIVLKLIFVL
jgi:hypothetical protein